MRYTERVPVGLSGRGTFHSLAERREEIPRSKLESLRHLS